MDIGQIIYFTVSVLPIIICLIYFKRLDFSFKLLLVLWVTGFITDIICRILANQHVNNILFINSFLLVEWITITFVFKLWNNHILQKFSFFKIFLIIFLNWMLVIFLKPYAENNYTRNLINFIKEGIFTFNTWAFILEALMIIFFSSTLLLKFSNIEPTLVKSAKFWIVLSYFIYFSINLVVFGTGEIKTQTDNGIVIYFYQKSWAIHNVISTISSILICIGLFLIPKSKKLNHFN